MARLPKNDKVVDIGTIAAALGVSKTTVSRAISGNGRVGAATRQRVQDYVKEHNYTPSVMARGLAMRCSYNISLVISKQFSDFERKPLWKRHPPKRPRLRKPPWRTPRPPQRKTT